ncbi:hypothetical protein BD769DRAFT_1390626 [Suillus cothurnatus]|nr:hypothetical protein BD769DRAFT_1390626 [Suillus cothurnatus]
MVWDSTSTEANMQIAVGTRDKIVQVLVLSTNSQLQAVFSVRLDNTVPKSVAFADNGCVYVFGLYDRNFIKLKGDDSAVIKEYSCQSVIRHAAVNQKRGMFIVDNATNGFTLYQLEGDEEPVRTFVTAAPSVSAPKQVAFGVEGRLISGGVTMDQCLVQTTAMCDLNGCCTVTSASPVVGHGKATINLWVYNYGTVKGTLTSEQSWPMSCVVTYVSKILVHFGALAVIICLLITDYFDTVATWSGDIAQHITTTQVFTFSDKHSQSAEVFKKAPGVHQEMVEQSNILILHELAGKLIEVI